MSATATKIDPVLEQKMRLFLASVNLSFRVPEAHEEVDGEDAKRYNHACDYPQNADYHLPIEELNKNGGIQDKTVLEIGSGPGNLSHNILLAGAARVVGLDPAEEMISHANAKYVHEIASGRMSFVQGSVYDVPKELQGQFDLVICQNSLHQLFDPKSALEGMITTLRSGGEVHIWDFRRDIAPGDLMSRMSYTKPEIWLDLANSICAALTTREIVDCLSQIQQNGHRIRFDVGKSRDLSSISDRAIAIALADPVPHYLDFRVSQKIVIYRL